MPNVKFLIAASLGLGLAGCGTLPTNTSMYSIHQPVVERSNYAIDLALDGSDGDGQVIVTGCELEDAMLDHFLARERDDRGSVVRAVDARPDRAPVRCASGAARATGTATRGAA